MISSSWLEHSNHHKEYFLGGKSDEAFEETADIPWLDIHAAVHCGGR
jgi:hypothetical protein